MLNYLSMRIYQDIFSNAEIISDSFPMVEIYDGVGYEVRSNMIVKNNDEVDVGCGNAFDNPDKEGEEGASNAPPEKVNNIIDTFHYDEGSIDKKGYVAYIKEYMKKVLGHLEKANAGRIEGFKSGAKDMVKWIMDNFDEFTVWTAEYDYENMLVLSYFKKKEDEAPYFIYFKDGLKSYKV